MASPRNQWITFREYFELAETEGVDLVEAAQALLQGIKATSRRTRVAGLRRQWDTPSEAERREWLKAEDRSQDLSHRLEGVTQPSAEESEAIRLELRALSQALQLRYEYRERLPRDPQLRNVPKSLWAMIDHVDNDLSSFWTDDEEKPCETASVEWLAGTIEAFDWDQREAYEALCVDRSQAREMLKLLAGKAERRGAPSGPRSSEAKAAAAGVLAAKHAGDSREIGKIAWDFIPEDIAKTDLGTRINRQVTRHVKAVLAGTKK
jgi:hypothetical protein